MDDREQRTLVEKEQRRIQKEKIQYWHVIADEAYAMKCAKYKAEIERYKPYVSSSNQVNLKKIPEKLFSKDQLRFEKKSLKELFSNKYLLGMIGVVSYEVYLLCMIPETVLSDHPLLLSIINTLSKIAPKLGYTTLYTMKHHNLVANPEVWRVYMALGIFVIAPIKILILTKWLNSERQNLVYRTLVISPITVVPGLAGLKEYRSMLSRVLWSITIVLFAIGAYITLLAGDSVFDPFYLIFGSLMVAISFCIIKDYSIYFKLARSNRNHQQIETTD